MYYYRFWDTQSYRWEMAWNGAVLSTESHSFRLVLFIENLRISQLCIKHVYDWQEPLKAFKSTLAIMCNVSRFRGLEGMFNAHLSLTEVWLWYICDWRRFFPERKAVSEWKRFLNDITQKHFLIQLHVFMNSILYEFNDLRYHFFITTFASY